MIEAAASGELAALVVGGVDVRDFGDPARVRAALDEVPFLVSLEVRASEVTERADVVLPVAPAVEKNGTFINWEGRLRPFGQARSATSLTDRDVLVRLTEEFDTDLGITTLADLYEEVNPLMEWDAAPQGFTPVPAQVPVTAGKGEVVLASHKPMIDAGRLQDGAPWLAGSARCPILLASAATLAAAGIAPGADATLQTERGRVTLPAAIADLPDSVAWVPECSTGSVIHDNLGGVGTVVTLRRFAGGGTMTLTPFAVPEYTAADFSDETWWLSLIKAVFIIVFLIANVLLALWVERRGLGRMQTRPGPNVAGPLGLFQAFADAGKLLFKEDMWTRRAERFLYFLAPAIAAFAAFSVYAVIPMGPNVTIGNISTPLQLTDMPVASLYILAIASLGLYGIVLGGWSTRSTLPLYGAVRSSAQVISYELAMGLSLVSVFLMSGSMSTSQIVAAQGQFWWAFTLFPAFVIYCISATGEVNRLPFDLPEAEGETRRRPHDRVLVDEVRLVLPVRVRQHAQRLGRGHHDVPRRLARPVAALPRRVPQLRLVGDAVVLPEDLVLHVPAHLDARHAAALPLRPVHEPRVEAPHAHRTGLARARRPRARHHPVRPALHASPLRRRRRHSS